MTKPIRRWLLGGCLLVATVFAGCSPKPSPVLPVPDSIPAPDPASIESVIFLLGDAGDAYLSTSPTLARMQQDVEWWASRLERDSAVAMFVLGDIRYPEGVRDPGTPEYPADTAVVMGQVRVVAGPAGLSRGARAYFLAGNHDWGERKHFDGFTRLVNLDNVLAHARETLGVPAELIPEAGTGGPHVIDWGDHLRLIGLDSAWWLLAGDAPEKAIVVDSLQRAYLEAGDREVMFLAHHPFQSAGPHGGGFSFWRTLGVRYIMFRSGAILQDITSRPFRQLANGLRQIFDQEGPPIAFLAGHDHSLQVLQGASEDDPSFNVITGSGSKLSDVAKSPDLLFSASAPGYSKILVEKDGGMILMVEAVESKYLSCPTTQPELAECMAEGVAAYRTVYWVRMK